MPEHDPQVGHAERSITARSASENLRVRRSDHRVDQVDLAAARRQLDLARFHRTPRHEHRRYVEPQSRHQHAGGYLVAVRNADQRVGAVGVGHVLDAVCDNLSRRQRIQHAVVSHRDPVIDRDGIEFFRDAARGLDFPRDELPHVFKVHVARDKLRERIHDRNDRFAEVAVAHPCRAPKTSGASHVAAVGCCSRAVRGHENHFEVGKVRLKSKPRLWRLRAPDMRDALLYLRRRA